MLKYIKLLAVLSIIFSVSFVSASEYQSNGCYLPKGTLYRGVLQSSLSSDFSNIGDVVRVINPHDIFIGKTLCIPKDSIFFGTVNYVQPSREGVNGAFSVKFDTLVFPSSQKTEIDGVIWSKKNGIIGGDFAPKKGYRTVLHRTEGLAPGSQILVPYGEGMMGTETKLKSGEEINLMLNNDVFIKFFNVK